eukprot:8221833-Lingulodinium_polyedra.AAC.1
MGERQLKRLSPEVAAGHGQAFLSSGRQRAWQQRRGQQRYGVVWDCQPQLFRAQHRALRAPACGAGGA